MVILKAFPPLARIIQTRDDAIAENAQLKFKMLEFEKLAEGHTSIVQASALAPAAATICSDDYSVKIFDLKDIPGKKGE